MLEGASVTSLIKFHIWGLKTGFLQETRFLGLMVAKIPRFR